MLEDIADFTPDAFDNTYLNMELAIPRDVDRLDFAKGKKRLRNKVGIPIGRPHNNPIVDTRMYWGEYKDGKKASLAANTEAENMFAQVDG